MLNIKNILLKKKSSDFYFKIVIFNRKKLLNIAMDGNKILDDTIYIYFHHN